MHLLLPAFIIGVAIVIGLVLFAVLRRHSPRDAASDPTFLLLQNQANAGIQQTAQQFEALRKSLSESIQTLSGQVASAMAEANRTVGDRLDNTTKVVGDVRQQLGQLKESSQQLVDLGKDISRLQDILQPPKLRGGLGELFLGDLLAQVLPAEHYQMQYHFKGGETVDAVIMLRTGMVPIDAKFPLENFKRVLTAGNDEERRTARKAFMKDVKGHIDAISAKYIRTDENTFDFALMYVPAENVYYETILKDDESSDEMSLFGYALKKRVVPVSPNSFYAYLQTIILGLKGMRVEERSREILDNLSRLHKDFENFADTFRVLGQHLDNSAKKYTEAQKRFEKVEIKIEQIDGLAKGLTAGQGADASEPLISEQSV